MFAERHTAQNLASLLAAQQIGCWVAGLFRLKHCLRNAVAPFLTAVCDIAWLTSSLIEQVVHKAYSLASLSGEAACVWRLF